MKRARIYQTKAWKTVRNQVLNVSRTCWLCGHGAANSVDHVIPLSLGGAPYDPGNLRPAHGVEGCPTCGKKCNSSKHNRMPRKPALTTSQRW
jgi:5-methylcytosine-specific restriction endonuclease McrA